jgi:hypothetical protein
MADVSAPLELESWLGQVLTLMATEHKGFFVFDQHERFPRRLEDLRPLPAVGGTARLGLGVQSKADSTRIYVRRNKADNDRNASG